MFNVVCVLFYRHRIGDTDNLVEIESDEILQTALTDLEDGFRLTVWAYDKVVSIPDHCLHETPSY